MIMKMPKVLDCSVVECAYNRDMECHTMAITVGSPCPMCDSFMSSMDKGGDVSVIGGIGACHQKDCRFNQSLECSAPGIHVGKHSQHADCETYNPR